MELFYADKFDSSDNELILSKNESHHCFRVLRKKTGDKITVIDGKGHLIYCTIKNANPHALTANVEKFKKFPFPDANGIHVSLAIIRPNRMDWAIEKLTELGVERITPLLCHFNSVKRIKLQHLHKIAINAMKQSEQFYLSQIDTPKTFDDQIKNSNKYRDRKFIVHPKQEVEGKDLNNLQNTTKHILVIGPEGGFHQQELKLADDYGFELLSLGPNILRTETAAVTGVVKIKQLMGII